MSSHYDNGRVNGTQANRFNPIFDRSQALLFVLCQIEHDQVDRLVRQEELVRSIIQLLSGKVPAVKSDILTLDRLNINTIRGDIQVLTLRLSATREIPPK